MRALYPPMHTRPSPSPGPEDAEQPSLTMIWHAADKFCCALAGVGLLVPPPTTTPRPPLILSPGPIAAGAPRPHFSVMAYLLFLATTRSNAVHPW